MPIGKNAIKRVSNNGYSSVKTTAPDMENSVVAEEKATVTEKLTPPTASPKAKIQSKLKDTKKPRAKQTIPKKSMETEPDFSPVKTAEKVTKKNTKSEARQGEGYVNLGGELPYYLL